MSNIRLNSVTKSDQHWHRNVQCASCIRHALHYVYTLFVCSFRQSSFTYGTSCVSIKRNLSWAFGTPYMLQTLLENMVTISSQHDVTWQLIWEYSITCALFIGLNSYTRVFLPQLPVMILTGYISVSAKNSHCNENVAEVHNQGKIQKTLTITCFPNIVKSSCILIKSRETGNWWRIGHVMSALGIRHTRPWDAESFPRGLVQPLGKGQKRRAEFLSKNHENQRITNTVRVSEEPANDFDRIQLNVMVPATKIGPQPKHLIR